MWRGHPFGKLRAGSCPRNAETEIDAEREPERGRSLRRTNATLMPSAEVPLITPATTISLFFIYVAAVLSLRESCLQSAPARRIPTASATGLQALPEREPSFGAASSPTSS